MRTNIGKFNALKKIVLNKVAIYTKELVKKYALPSKLYTIDYDFSITELHIKNIYISHSALEYYTKKPTKLDIANLKDFIEHDDYCNITYIRVGYVLKNIEGNIQKGSTIFKNILDKTVYFYSKEKAIEASKIMLKEREKAVAFQIKYAKPKNYDYNANGYRFLGWQNNWQHEYYDKDKNLCSESKKPPVYFDYNANKYPEYAHCKTMKHRLIEVSLSDTGSEHIVSCPICKVYWKYDSSD